ncbi:hypothetical protein LCGC14_1580800 [marine sediment metagenome]|uniref:Homing endonuclease LAGLIDADG domain-containing protein n=1 Tax=marine sediment metagenome TaxID=412755 RepID=A0A0F9LH36_9ZZZZ
MTVHAAHWKLRNPGHAPAVRAARDDILWAAGVYEGDGSCCRNNGTEQVSVSQKDDWLLGRLRSLFGGTVRGPYSNHVSSWVITGARARGFLQSIYGLLSPRRQKQVIKAMRLEVLG